MRIRYDPKLKEVARKLRGNPTLSEVLLWHQLKKRELMGYDFHRQKPIDGYIVDFFCSKLGLIIEIDGGSHSGKAETDRERQSRLEGLSLHFLRFSDADVKDNMEGVVLRIREWISSFERSYKTHP